MTENTASCPETANQLPASGGRSAPPCSASDTPETDALHDSMGSDPWTSYDRLLKHARERERERSQLRAAVNLATDYMRGWGSIQALAALEKIELILPQNASGVAAAGATPD